MMILLYSTGTRQAQQGIASKRQEVFSGDFVKGPDFERVLLFRNVSFHTNAAKIKENEQILSSFPSKKG